ncbi:hypothetical protein C7S16_4855 [Burkholderia thailandensis]|uniref:Uncharacterized protein n=1 Tax=Burkholderia thailandensis TaxID=57975 RepID=A0AAW9CMD2_BURTH|nr:hypothetical protein [Burkholderia thailandensis]MDW9251292.1 hypothetical protein [Burkholderia thailandensis]
MPLEPIQRRRRFSFGVLAGGIATANVKTDRAFAAAFRSVSPGR